MGTRRNVSIDVQHPVVDVVPIPDERLWLRVYRADNWRENDRSCEYCGMRLRLHEVTADHVVPRHKGGVTTKENIKPSCKPCNQAKAAMTAAAFKKAIRGPTPDHKIEIHLAHMRWKMERRTEQAVSRIMRLVGVK